MFGDVPVRVLTHQKPPRLFCMLFFEVLPFTTLASSVFMVTFFISSSVCRHCKMTHDAFGVLLLNLVIKQDFYLINREVSRLLPRVSGILAGY